MYNDAPFVFVFSVFFGAAASVLGLHFGPRYILSTQRLKKDRKRVCIYGPDAHAFESWVVFIAMAPACLAFAMIPLNGPPLWALLFLPAFLLVLAHGSTLELSVTRRGVTCTRRLLWGVTWQRSTFAAAEAWLDFGQFEPDSLLIGEPAAKVGRCVRVVPRLRVFLFGSTWGTEAEKLASNFNRAIKSLNEPRAYRR